MGNSVSAAAVPALSAAISAVELVNLLDPWPGATSSATVAAAQASALHSGVLFFSAAGFAVSVAFMNRHLHRGGAAAAEEGAVNRRLSEIVLYVCAGVLQYFLFAQAAPAGDPDAVDHGAPQLQEARALGLAAVRILPAAATVTFFLGALLIVAGHIRSGGEGGGGAVVAVAGEEEPIQAQAPPLGLRLRLRLLSRMALAAAAGTVCLMAFAVYGAYY